jgi:rubrerythrin
MQVYETFDPNPFRVNAYRTDEVLFIHILPSSWENFHRRLLLYIKLIGSFFFPIILLFIVGAVNNATGNFAGLAVMLAVLSGFIGFLAFYFYLLTQKQLLIRIDRNTIHKTSWYFGKGRHETLSRPNEIFFYTHEGHWHLGAEKGFIRLNVRDHELRWISEIIAQFENEIPVFSSETETEIGTKTENETNSPIATNSVADTTESDCHVLDDMEYQGQKLRRILNPTEQYRSNNITKNKLPDELPETLYICCSHCNLPLPTDYVLADTALAQCPYCGFLFEVADLKRYPLPRRSNIEIQTDENILKLHQRPRFCNLPLYCFLIFFVFLNLDLVCAVFYIDIRLTNPEATLQDIVPEGSHNHLVTIIQVLAIVHVFFFLLFLWSIFVHRFVEFRRNDVYFCIRWLCFWWSWTVPRNHLGVCRLTALASIFNYGFQIPYGTKSFCIGAGIFETHGIVGEINHWLLTHPPETFPVSDDFPKFENTFSDSFSENRNNRMIGGVTEKANKEIRLHCCDCGHRFLTKELDFPNRTAFCPNCNQKSDPSQLQYYTVEPKAVKPEFLQLSVKESGKEQRIEFSLPPMKTLAKIVNYTVLTIFAFAILMIIGSGIIVTVSNGFINKQGMDFIASLVAIPIALLGGLFYALFFWLGFFTLYDELRQKFTAWTTRFSDDYFELTRRYKNRSETIRIECNRIVRFQRGKGTKNFGESIKGYPLFGRFPSNLESRGRIRNEIILTDGTTIYLPILPESKNNRGWNDWLVNTWNEQLHKFR